MENVIKDLNLLYELKRELRQRRKAYNESVKGLKHSIQSLEADVIEKVLEGGKTVQTARIKAEYKPTVVIKMKKEEETE